MGKKIAVAVIHGIGKQTADFVNRFREKLFRELDRHCHEDIILRGVLWSYPLQERQMILWERMLAGGLASKGRLAVFMPVRRFMIDYIADTLAYQPTGSYRNTYEQIHASFAKTIKTLGQEAGEDAPLCVVAHSLGSVIASNYIYDLQTHPTRPIIPESVLEHIDATPIEKGETLALFYTLGSPIALWSLRYKDFGQPIAFPHENLDMHYPHLHHEWVNMYDQQDVIGFPLETLNEKYAQIVRDKEVNVGNLAEFWNPLSHLAYWDADDVVPQIARSIERIWEQINS